MFVLVNPGFEFLFKPDPSDALALIERAGRTCYKSEDRIEAGRADPFVRRLVQRGHESVLEHSLITVKFIFDRGVSHELVRHRLAAYSQESTRYCDYGDRPIAYVTPPWLNLTPGQYWPPGHPTAPQPASAWTCRDPAGRTRVLADLEPAADTWLAALAHASTAYQSLRANRWSPQQARSVLPTALKTEIVVSANFREWRHILRLRSAMAAHPQIREVMQPLLRELAGAYPAVFGDLTSADKQEQQTF